MISPYSSCREKSENMGIRSSSNSSGDSVERGAPVTGHVRFLVLLGQSEWRARSRVFAHSGLFRCEYGELALLPLCAGSNHMDAL
jgi:hypothetical protein